VRSVILLSGVGRIRRSETHRALVRSLLCLLCRSAFEGVAVDRAVRHEGLVMADTVEKLGIRTKTMAAASRLARGDLLDVPSSVQMMGFVG